MVAVWRILRGYTAPDPLDFIMCHWHLPAIIIDCFGVLLFSDPSDVLLLPSLHSRRDDDVDLVAVGGLSSVTLFGV